MFLHIQALKIVMLFFRNWDGEVIDDAGFF